jgi:quercetin dioxygenase-like cupin family protein
MKVIPTATLDTTNFSHELLGRDHGDPGVSLILVEAAPGQGPSLHQHPYAEIIVILEGEGTFTDGTTSETVGAGHVLIIPADEPHAFTNTGDGPLRQIDIHVADAFITDRL